MCAAQGPETPAVMHCSNGFWLQMEAACTLQVLHAGLKQDTTATKKLW